MRILSIDYEEVKVPLVRPYEIAFLRHDHVKMAYVFVRTECGIVGYGSASPAKEIAGESIEDCLQALAKVKEQMRGDIRELPRMQRQLMTLTQGAPAARAAIDMALYDIYAKKLEIPLVSLLGVAHQSMPTSITIGIMDVSSTLVEAKEYFDRGFRYLKVKIGNNVEEDCERLSKLREVYGDSIHIRVDPNQGYDLPTLESFLKKSSKLNIEFTEQAMKPELDTQLLKLAPDQRALMAADESLHYPEDALRLAADPKPFGIFNIKLMKCGGVFQAKRIATVAELAGIDLMWGCMDESVVSISAALSAALSSPNTKYLDLDGSFDLAQDGFLGGFDLKDGKLSPRDLPGLGVERISG